MPSEILSKELSPLEAYDELMAFAGEKGEHALKLAAHAAVPQSIRPDFLHLLRTNFVPEAVAETWIEVDVLLASFCESLGGGGYYRFDPEARRLLLEHLDSSYANDKVPRVHRVAHLLLAYAEHLARTFDAAEDVLTREYLEVQRWVAFAFVYPDLSAEQLAYALEGVADGDVVARAQIGNLISSLSAPLYGHPDLLTYAAGIQALNGGQFEHGRQLLERMGDSEVIVGRVKLRRPKQVLAEVSSMFGARPIEPVGSAKGGERDQGAVRQQLPDDAPAEIGRYEVQELIGEGDSGRMYKAFDPRVGRHVAIQVFKSEDDPVMLRRFQADASAVGRLHHINIATIFEYGTFHDGQYIVMEYLEGANLDQLMRGRRPLSLFDKVRIMRQVGEALRVAHESGVIHRDVKASDISVGTDGTAKLMGFGFSRITDYPTRTTRKDDLMGAVRYMAPERFTGLEVSERSDIFSYGVVFYELIAGVHPFEARDATTLMYKITTGAVKPLADVSPGCPSELSWIVMRAMERDQDMRYQSMSDLLLDMQPLVNALQKDRAAEIVKQASEWFDSGQVEKAQDDAREALELDPSNAAARELRGRIHIAVRRKSVAARVEALLKDAEASLRQRQFPQAIEWLESAARFDPENALVQDQLKAARSQMEAQRRLEQALEAARRLLMIEDYDAAFAQLEGVRELPDPNGVVASMVRQVLERKEERARERLRADMQLVRGLLKESGFTEARTRLELLYAEFPDDAELAALLDYTRQQQAAARERIAPHLTSIREFEEQGQLEHALNACNAALREFPSEPELVALAEVLHRKIEFERRDREVRQAMARHDWSRVESLLGELARTLPGEPKVSELRRLLETERKSDPE